VRIEAGALDLLVASRVADAIDPFVHRRAVLAKVLVRAGERAIGGPLGQDEAAARTEFVELAVEDRPGVVLERIEPGQVRLCEVERPLGDLGIAEPDATADVVSD
jgi:hypothetical protein